MMKVCRSGYALRLVALLMLFMVLKVYAVTPAPEGEKNGPLLKGTGSTVCCTLEQAAPAPHEEHKPPKHSYTDYDSLLASSGAAPVYAPPLLPLPHSVHSAAALDTYRTIFVPPQNHA
ncbi:hypothetical protein [Geobacter sp. DSM 9736]|uniref:hypothetical protein n=1 Tax=Geobacter sp. DSM 9736 TaxID=1277350 RepID=UPI000B509693|nr:hypothetical protein [Geobacter sp. DSM 9736]SNB46917.1 hypothetical protein SAMN06269301_2389 [Geobacter sp. DSM 9736]